MLAPLLRRVQRNVFGRRLANVEVEELAEATRQLLAGQSLTRSELGRLLAERWPAAERSALAWSAQYLEPMLHPPPSGTWNVAPRSMPCVLASDWLPDEEPSDGSEVSRTSCWCVGTSRRTDPRRSVTFARGQG